MNQLQKSSEKLNFFDENGQQISDHFNIYFSKCLLSSRLLLILMLILVLNYVLNRLKRWYISKNKATNLYAKLIAKINMNLIFVLQNRTRYYFK
ncbi:hypothetical protein C3744_29665 [Priestia megaterium]|uniref:Uncharacterized protein n=1 Tax=Priestia megaterium TaxID=1404 RepID=A0A3D8WTB7_PRIMG|nr:hypothetical protein C3744_29665 [Priestia megaterium]